MPGRAMFKRAGIAALLIGAAALLTACASADHSWRGEFDARLEGAVAALEETLAETGPRTSELELAKAFYPLGQKLLFKGELIEKLDPPAGCEAIQERGRRQVNSTGVFASTLLKNLTPYLKRNLSGDVRDQIATLKRLVVESSTCE